MWVINGLIHSGLARAFLGGRVAHPEGQNEEENEEKLRKNERKHRKMRKNWENVLILPIRDERLATALLIHLKLILLLWKTYIVVTLPEGECGFWHSRNLSNLTSTFWSIVVVTTFWDGILTHTLLRTAICIMKPASSVLTTWHWTSLKLNKITDYRLFH